MRKLGFKPCVEVLESRITPDITFTGPGTGIWTDEAYWQNGPNPLGRLPGLDDDVVIDRLCTIPADANPSVRSIQINSGLIIQASASLTVASATVNAGVAVFGQMTVNGCTPSLSVQAGNLAVATGGQLAVSGMSITGGNFIVSGTATVEGALSTTNAGSIFVRQGTLTAQTIENAGRMEVIGTINANVTNSGTLYVGRAPFDPGAATINGNLTTTGTVQFRVDGDESSTLEVAGNLTANGTMTTDLVDALAQPGRNDSFGVITYCGTLTGRFGNATFTMNDNPYHLDFRPSFITIAPTPRANNDECNVNQGGTASVAVLSNDECPYGTATILAINGMTFTVGTPITLPSGASVTVNNDGTITYEPSEGSYISDCMQYTLGGNPSDAEDNGTSIATVTFTVYRVIFFSPGDQVNDVDATVYLNLLASSPNGHTLSYVATGLPPGLTLQTGLLGEALIGGTIETGAEGIYAVSITATDDETGISVTITFTWTVYALGGATNQTGT